MMESMKNRRRAAGEGGFTLIELLVVIVILGILAGVVVFAVSGINDKGEDSACKADTATIRTAMEANYAQNGDYTATPANWDGVTPASGGGARTVVNETALVTAGFLSTVSNYHDVAIYDNNDDSDAAGDITPLVEVTVADVKCGTVGGVVGVGSNF